MRCDRRIAAAVALLDDALHAPGSTRAVTATCREPQSRQEAERRRLPRVRAVLHDFAALSYRRRDDQRRNSAGNRPCATQSESTSMPARATRHRLSPCARAPSARCRIVHTTAVLRSASAGRWRIRRCARPTSDRPRRPTPMRARSRSRPPTRAWSLRQQPQQSLIGRVDLTSASPSIVVRADREPASAAACCLRVESGRAAPASMRSVGRTPKWAA